MLFRTNAPLGKAATHNHAVLVILLIICIQNAPAISGAQRAAHRGASMTHGAATTTVKLFARPGKTAAQVGEAYIRQVIASDAPWRRSAYFITHIDRTSVRYMQFTITSREGSEQGAMDDSPAPDAPTENSHNVDRIRILADLAKLMPRGCVLRTVGRVSDLGHGVTGVRERITITAIGITPDKTDFVVRGAINVVRPWARSSAIRTRIPTPGSSSGPMEIVIDIPDPA